MVFNNNGVSTEALSTATVSEDTYNFEISEMIIMDGSQVGFQVQ